MYIFENPDYKDTYVSQMTIINLQKITFILKTVNKNISKFQQITYDV